MSERLYGLFKPTTLPNGRRRYERVPGTGSYRKPIAVRQWQDRLIWEGLTLRPVKEGSGESSRTPELHVEAGQCRPCFEHLHSNCERTEACRCACRMWNK